MRASLAWGALGVVALLLITSNAEAFCRKTTCVGAKCKKDDHGCGVDGAKVQWKTKCVSYNFNEKGSRILDPAAARIAVANAFDAWSLVDCGGGKFATMVFSEEGDVPCDKAQYKSSGPNVHLVIFRDDLWKYKEDPSGSIPDTLATTTVSFSPETGEIYDADLEINSAYVQLTTDDPPKAMDDLQSIITHEVGHFIGIDHSDVADAVMYYQYQSGTLNRKLTDDDIAAVCEAYPPDRDVACDSIPKGGFSATCNDDDDSSCSMAPATRGENAPSSGVNGILGLCLTCVATYGARRLKKEKSR